MSARGVAEWRRRGLGGDGVPQTFDGAVAVSADDGYWAEGGTFFNSSWNNMIIGDSAGTFYHSWHRVPSVTIPNGATIDSGYFEPYMRSWGNDGSGTKTNVYFNTADDAVAPTGWADADGKGTTTAFVAWDDENFSEGFKQSGDIAAAVQEIVDRVGWASGQAMMILWKNDSSTDPKRYKGNTIDFGPYAAKLHVEFTA